MVFQRKVGSAWRNVKTVKTNSSCVAVLSYKITATTTFRVIAPATDADHTAGTSAAVTVRRK